MQGALQRNVLLVNGVHWHQNGTLAQVQMKKLEVQQLRFGGGPLFREIKRGDVPNLQP